MEKPKVVILCGGEGTRLREETEYKPKPMVSIGGLPVIWHIMKAYAHYGFSDFVLCLGYRGDMIKQFFLSHEMMHNDFTLRLSDRSKDTVHRDGDGEDWTVTFADTGLKAMTGARLKRVEKYIDGEAFFATYGDGLTDADLSAEFAFHKKHGRAATLLGVHPHSRYGLVKPGKDGLVESFSEKPVLEEYINGGFYVFGRKLFDYLDDSDGCVLETAPFMKMVGEKQVSMYRHDGFWFGMDTYKDYLEINRVWDSGKRPWKVWAD
jgi:glucose-1-phosphate cytidylyltransferase